jgi:hypothetical protein
MKKIIIIISIAFAGFGKVSANDADMFTYDKTAVQNSLSDLSVLESYVTEHPALAVVHESGNGNVIVNGIELTSNPMQRGHGHYWAPVPYAPFFWGCFLGPIGLFIVMSSEGHDNWAVRMAAGGCVFFCVWFWYFFWAPVYYR